MEWIEFNFTGGCTWENMGTYWDIDHVIPIKLLDMTNEEHVCVCFSWMNLLPLEKKANVRKHHHLMPLMVVCQEMKLRQFAKKYSNPSVDQYISRYSSIFESLLQDKAVSVRHGQIAGTP
jgi:hypothetical protein